MPFDPYCRRCGTRHSGPCQKPWHSKAALVAWALWAAFAAWLCIAVIRSIIK